MRDSNQPLPTPQPPEEPSNAIVTAGPPPPPPPASVPHGFHITTVAESVDGVADGYVFGHNAAQHGYDDADAVPALESVAQLPGYAFVAARTAATRAHRRRQERLRLARETPKEAQDRRDRCLVWERDQAHRKQRAAAATGAATTAAAASSSSSLLLAPPPGGGGGSHDAALSTTARSLGDAVVSARVCALEDARRRRVEEEALAGLRALDSVQTRQRDAIAEALRRAGQALYDLQWMEAVVRLRCTQGERAERQAAKAACAKGAEGAHQRRLMREASVRSGALTDGQEIFLEAVSNLDARFRSAYRLVHATQGSGGGDAASGKKRKKKKQQQQQMLLLDSLPSGARLKLAPLKSSGGRASAVVPSGAATAAVDVPTKRRGASKRVAEAAALGMRMKERPDPLEFYTSLVTRAHLSALPQQQAAQMTSAA